MPSIPVAFPNRHGLQLAGVLELPDGPVGTLGAVLLSPGVKMRVGPQGLYRRIAGTLVSMGIPVLRFDFHGLGDSEGTLAEDQLRDVYNQVQVGRYIEDTIDAMDWLSAQHGIRRFILSGLCGGAITGLLAGARDARVVGLLGLGITPVLSASSADASRYMTVGQIQETERRYARRILNPRAWWRLLTFQADTRLIKKVVAHWIRRRVGRQAAPVVTPPRPEHDDANPLFPPAFFAWLSQRRPMLLVFGGSDRLRWEFDEKFVQRHKERLDRYEHAYDLHVIELANHVLTLPEWQQELLSESQRWVRRHFAADLEHAGMALQGSAAGAQP